MEIRLISYYFIVNFLLIFCIYWLHLYLKALTRSSFSFMILGSAWHIVNEVISSFAFSSELPLFVFLSYSIFFTPRQVKLRCETFQRQRIKRMRDFPNLPHITGMENSRIFWRSQKHSRSCTLLLSLLPSKR